LLSVTLTLLGLHCRLVVGWHVSYAVSPLRWPRQRTIRLRLSGELTLWRIGGSIVGRPAS